MTIINFMNAEVYNDSLELFFKRGLWDYVKKNSKYTIVENRSQGDVILDVKCRFAEQVEKMSGLKVLYFPDNLDRAGEVFNQFENLYDYVFFAHTNTLIDNKRYFHLPVAYDPYTHYPRRKEQHNDVTFVGTKHEDRYFLTDVPNILIYGNGWGDTIFPVYDAKKRKVYAQAKIIVNHHVAGDTSPNMRTFECLAMGSFLLSDIVPDYLDRGMVKYNSFDDLVTKIDYYIGHEDKRELIAAKGAALVKPHTYEARMAEMIEVIENARVG